MKIYLAHSTSFDYVNALYAPLKQIDDYEIYFPHDNQNNGESSKDIIFSSDLVVAEVSHPSTGQGIELGWAESRGVPIICIYHSGSTPSGALSVVSKDFVEYSTAEDLLDKVRSILNNKSLKLVH